MRAERSAALTLRGLLAFGGASLAWGSLALSGSLLTYSEGRSLVAACWALMSRALSHVMDNPLTLSLAPIVGFFLIGSFLLAAVKNLGRVVKTSRLLRSVAYVEERDLPPSLLLGFRESPALAGIQVKVLRDSGVAAFTWGFLRPKVYLSEGLLRSLSREETRSVLLHEAAHVRRRDPLRGMAVGILSSALWFLPVSSFLRRRFAEAMEKAADEDAVKTGVEPLHLASILVKVAKAKSSALATVTPSLQGGASLADRVMELMGKGKRRRFPRKPLVVSLGVALFIGLFSQVRVPLPGASMHPPTEAPRMMSACPMGMPGCGMR
jgi:Zn-dependent protease with chaperone function